MLVAAKNQAIKFLKEKKNDNRRNFTNRQSREGC